MGRLVLACALIAGASTTGCATLFTGSSQEVRITSNAPETTCVVLGGSFGSMLSLAGKASFVAQKIFDILDPVLSAEAREALRTIDINELITLVAMHFGKAELPPALVKGREYLQKIPGSAVKKLMDLFSLQDLGPTPRTVKLKKGKSYAVVAWAAGHKARVETIGVRPNWVTLLNFFNAGLGLLIDIPTGAWLNLEHPIAFRLPALE